MAGSRKGSGFSLLLTLLVVFYFASSVFRSCESTFSGSAEQEYTIQNDDGEHVNRDFKVQFVTSSLDEKEYSIELSILKSSITQALSMMEELEQLSIEELGIDPDLEYRSPDLYQLQLWRGIYSRVFSHGYPLLEKIARGFHTICEKEEFNGKDKIRFIVAFVQQIEYERPGGAFDLFHPVIMLDRKFGDCDTKALLLHILLERMGVDCAIYWSSYYRHAMLGIASGSYSGTYKLFSGKKYYFLETTMPGWEIGDMPPDVRQVSRWHLMKINHNVMNR